MNRPSELTLLAGAAGLCIAALFAASSVHAESPDWSRIDDAQLETLFWDCDARATQEGLSAGDGALCVMAHDALKQRRFDGDFERLLAWWQAHKREQYARRGIEAPDDSAAADAKAEERAMQAP